ncbi:putative signal recognition particle receptor subunit alpha isoform X2 [Apostichopus japonicus]|uniref:Putative signal recognition particle receptor subunit alpha isoform X2 n=1 Tax=Stichopus japonicus TaxID=307972 RepID=A0A2G8KRR3_STIJA|nr:putative signal recognition particle receptor subunit alpha isoform X2 [Apostichopus japonicus]
MLDLFTIFSKGGIVLWYFQGTYEAFGPPVNSLIKSIILQERGGDNSFNHGALTLKYKLDNEFELVFVVAYQNIIRLSYIDKFLDDIQRAFRAKYEDALRTRSYGGNFEFTSEFRTTLKDAVASSDAQKKVEMKSFEESSKSKKTINSMIMNAGDDEKKKGAGADGTPKKKKKKNKGASNKGTTNGVPAHDTTNGVSNGTMEDYQPKVTNDDGGLDEETRQQNLMKLMKKGSKPKEKKEVKKPPTKKGKQNQDWGLNGKPRDFADLDFSKSKQPVEATDPDLENERKNVGESATIQDLAEESSDGEEEEEDIRQDAAKTKKSSYGLFSMFSGLVGSKKLSKEDMGPVMAKMRDHLIAKNVAQEIAEKVCDSVAKKLEGKVMGTFDRVANVVRAGMEESLVQILTPQRRVDILRDAVEARSQGRPYSVTFCGVNGVGKSTNLAKICFWLVENKFRVLIAACDTFRSGAVEQLRTHHRRLNALHPVKGGSPNVFLFEKGYGKDSAGVAMEAIKYGEKNDFVV